MECMDYISCREEFLKETQGRKVLCAEVHTESGWGVDTGTYYLLKRGYSQEDWGKFLDAIDFEYDAGYGGHALFGTIWYADGTWSERAEYDGSEWWAYKECPEIPPEVFGGVA